MAHPQVSLVALVLVLAAAGAAGAQQPQGPPSTRTTARAALLEGGGAARLVVTWADRDEDCAARLSYPGGEPQILHDGPSAATLVSGHGAVLVAYSTYDARAPFHVRLLRREGASHRLGPAVDVARPGGRDDIPFAVVAAARPEGFAVFFQEIEAADPSAAHTYLLETDPLGAPRGPAREVRVPWSLADAVWNGQGYHLALIYPGSGQGMRLSMVSLSAEAAPEQHPDWSSRAGFIADVHLVNQGGRILAFFHNSGRLVERDVTQIRAWGSEPPPGRDHGALGPDQLIAVALEGAAARPQRLSATP